MNGSMIIGICRQVQKVDKQQKIDSKVYKG